MQEEIGEMARIHSFISCRENGSSDGGQRINLFSIVSQLFHSALCTSRKGSKSVAQASRDAFLVAQKISHETVSHVSRLKSHYNPPAPTLTLRDWFPWK